jgi:anti-sigma B factor antagonist
MDIQLIKNEAVTTIRFIGRLDTPASADAAKAVEPALQDAAGTIVLDCSEMTYISSSGLRIFLTLRKAAAATGGKVIVQHISPDIRQVFMITGFLNLFEIED